MVDKYLKILTEWLCKFFCHSGSKYEDNMEQMSDGVGLSTALLNRANPKLSQQSSSATAVATSNATNVRTP